MRTAIDNVEKTISSCLASGENIQKALDKVGVRQGSLLSIQKTYDAQAGSYISATKNNLAHELYIQEICEHISRTCISSIKSVLDVGCGDGTSLKPILEKLIEFRVLHQDYRCIAMDIAPKRVLAMHEFMNQEVGNQRVFGMIGSSTNIPLSDSCIDLCLSIHALEPNYENSGKIIQEIIRVCNKYCVFVEPIYEEASEAQRSRMDEFKYFKGFYDRINSSAVALKVLLNGDLKHNINPLNKSKIIILQKL